MAEIQKETEAEGYSDEETLSGDESEMLFEAQPLRQHFSLSADRHGDDKPRFTSFLHGSAGMGIEPLQ